MHLPTYNEPSDSVRSVMRGVGGYLPDQVILNDQLSQKLNTNHDWIASRTGIHQRHIASPHESTSDLALYASKEALQQAGWSPKDLDLIIVATSTPDHTVPSLATGLQEKLGIVSSIAFDIAAACSGFIFALNTADLYLKQSMAKTALVVGADTYSRLLDWNDRSTAVLFGDGAGAVLLERSSASSSQDRGIIGSLIRSYSPGYHALRTSGGPGSYACSGILQMKGPEVYKNAVLALGHIVEDILKLYNISLEKVDWLVPHQANKRIIDATAQKFSIAPEKIIYTIEKHANTSAASIPLALNEAVRDGRIQPGHLVLCQAFGAGFTCGATLLRF